MANVLTTGAWVSAPSKTLIFRTIIARSRRIQSAAGGPRGPGVHCHRRAAKAVGRCGAANQPFARRGEALAMITLIIIQLATRLARFGNEVRETWRETQRLRRTLAGPMEE